MECPVDKARKPVLAVALVTAVLATSDGDGDDGGSLIFSCMVGSDEQ